MCHQHSAGHAVPGTVVTGQLTTASGLPMLTFRPRHDHRTGHGPGDTEHPGPRLPPVVIATDIYGVSAFYQHLAGLLAAAGHPVFVPDLFFRVGPARDGSREAAFERRRKLDDRQALADLADAVATCRTPETRHAVLGFCLGGTLALLTAASDPGQITVTYYAFPKDVPGGDGTLTAPVDVASGIRGPVLAFWGRKDFIDPGEIALLQTGLAASAGTSDVRIYPDAGHGFLAGLTEQSPDTPAARDAWARTLDFLAAEPAPEPHS
jgi:dienelactone hydrolase